MIQWLVPLRWTDSARLSRWRMSARRIIRRSERLKSLDDAELLRRGRELRWRAATGEPLRSVLVEAYSLVREAARRTSGMSHYPVQIMGGIALFEGNIAEMQTGEGKTLTATCPVFLRALAGKGCHVITVNDYLARRDAHEMGPIYEVLGLTVGCIQSEMGTDERRAAYAKDITYGTAKEFGFDFLRDRLRMGASGPRDARRRPMGTGPAQGELPVQRGHYFALVDEADSVLIDEARTPLIIGLTEPNPAAMVNLYRWSRRVAAHLQPEDDFVFDPEQRSVYLTDHGCRRVLLTAKPSLMSSIDTDKIYTHVEQALTAHLAYQRDRDYVVVKDEVVIVDESTGRMMDGRKWQDGLHQAVEAKEMVPITAATGQAARVTTQSFFRQYTHLAGMTGTAWQVRRELKKTYFLRTSCIPTHRRCIRRGLPTRIFATQQQKRVAVIDEIETMRDKGRSVLVGTPSVDASEALATLLNERGIPHTVLNARYHEQEAEIVSHAGEPGRVMIATNMAGRGTDIKLHPEVARAGGLHVIATEVHSSYRIDRQLIGRAARQGDPGSYRFFLSLEDELFRCLKPRARERLKRRAGSNAKGELPAGWVRAFRRTQRVLERMHAKQRRELLKQEKQRTETYERMGLDPYLELTE
jgi:preprotein translocase subunit SecA